MKAAIYTRVSTTYQIDKDSLPFQNEELKNYAKYVLNIDDIELFQDAGYSGKNTERPAFLNMMKRIRDGEFTHLLVYKIDRISRNLLDFCEIYEELKKYKVTFISKNEQFDTSSAMGETMLKIILVFAELERKLTAERVTAIMLSRAEKGMRNGGRPAWGYKWVDDKLVYSDDSYKIKFIFDTYEMFQSTSSVIEELNKNNISSSRGGRINTKTISDIIRNPVYKGDYRYNYRETSRGSIKDESEWIIIENHHEAIVTKGKWELCNKIMDENAQRNSSRFRKNVNIHIFSSLLKCSDCGIGFVANSDKVRKSGYVPSRYRCHGRLDKNGCNAKLVTDVKIGSFIMNFLVNIVRSVKIINRNTTIKEIENMLLKNIDNVKIDINNIIDTHAAIIYNYSSNKIFTSKSQIQNNIIQKDNLASEKEKYTRALKRLQDLYLFDDDAMSEKDYLIKKKDIEEKLNSIESKLLTKNNSNVIDFDFAKQANDTSFIKSIITDDKLDMYDLDMRFGKDVIKEFVNNLVDNIYIENADVKSIKMKNGLIYNFFRD